MKRYFTPKRKQEIYERDKYKCQLGCNGELDKPHHCFYGSKLPKNWKKGDDINGLWNGVTLCVKSHYAMHNGTEFCNGKSYSENRKYLEGLAQERYNNLKKI
jgi:hypothetical protein